MASTVNVPVVLVHGWGGSFRETWQKPGIDALLSDVGRTPVGLDLLGHGEQDKPHDPEAYVELPSWLLAQLPEEPIVDAIGFSLGALTILRALINAPHRFGKVVLSGIGDGVFTMTPPDGNKRIVDALEGRAPEEDTFARMFAHYGNSPGNDLLALTALGCDIRIAADTAKMAPGFAKRGILPESGGTWLLPRMVGYARAAEIAFTGRTLMADECLAMGLVNKVVPADQLMDHVMDMAGEIASNAPLAVRAIKRMMRAAETETFEQNVHHVFLQLLPLFRTKDFKEGVAAFIEKRPPIFIGR